MDVRSFGPYVRVPRDVLRWLHPLSMALSSKKKQIKNPGNNHTTNCALKFKSITGPQMHNVNNTVAFFFTFNLFVSTRDPQPRLSCKSDKAKMTFIIITSSVMLYYCESQKNGILSSPGLKMYAGSDAL